MCSFDDDDWGTWKFSDCYQEKIKSLTAYLKCQPSHPVDCEILNHKSWRFMIEKLETKGITTLKAYPKDSSSSSKPNELQPEPEYENGISSDIIGEVEDECSTGIMESDAVLEDDEIIKMAGDICDHLMKEPMAGLSAKVKGKEIVDVLQAINNGLPDEESLANLLYSVCPPVEDNLLEQSRWIPLLYQNIILPKMLSRISPVPRALSSAISQLASSSPEACIQLFCIPLLLSPNVLNRETDVLQPAVEVLTKVTEESLPPPLKASLFRAFHKGVSSRTRVAIPEELFPLLQTLAESEGAFNGADSEALSNFIDCLERCSVDYASSMKFTKYLVAVLKGMSQESNGRKDSNVHYLSAEDKVKLRNAVSQNKTFLKKIAEKLLQTFI
ncbi:uncharacterized protein [Hetaerina americana]|uniref:uncharacterized protein n=1 Tax=Hetaerina americana TaxID=62018 RepID=UPI003A7F4460